TGAVWNAGEANDRTAGGTDAGRGRRNVDRKAVFVPDKPLEMPNGAILTFSLKQMHGGWNSDDNQNNNLGRFRFSVTSADRPVADPLPRVVRNLLAIPAAHRTPAQNAAVFSYWRRTVAEWKDDNAKVEALWKQHPVGSSQLALMAREKMRTTFLLARGDFLKPVRPVQPGIPAALNPLPPGAEDNRL